VRGSCWRSRDRARSPLRCRLLSSPRHPIAPRGSRSWSPRTEHGQEPVRSDGRDVLARSTLARLAPNRWRPVLRCEVDRRGPSAARSIAPDALCGSGSAGVAPLARLALNHRCSTQPAPDEACRLRRAADPIAVGSPRAGDRSSSLHGIGRSGQSRMVLASVNKFAHSPRSLILVVGSPPVHGRPDGPAGAGPECQVRPDPATWEKRNQV
jgi:hypothetical protein